MYKPGGVFDANAQVEAYRSLVDGALADGFTGLRVAADTGALVTTEHGHRRFLEYELAVDRVMATAPMSALSALSATAVGERINDLLHAVHPCSHGAEPEGLHAYFDEVRSDDGGSQTTTLVLRGEADLRTQAVFDAVLFALTSGSTYRGLHVHDLRFVDVRSLVRLNEVASVLAAIGQPVQIYGLAAVARRCATLLELAPLLDALVDALVDAPVDVGVDQ